MGLLTGGAAYLLSHVLPFLVVLTVLVFVHELGHYLLARWNGVRVEVFSIGFGPELFGWWDRRGTRWRISAIPVGGYVKMFGDADAASTPGAMVETMSPEDRAVSFHHQSIGARSAILAAGPGANFLFTILVLAAIYMTIGEPNIPAEVGQVVPDSAAAAAGLQPGDVFVSLGGSKVSRFEDIQRIVRLNTGTTLPVVVHRGDQELTIDVTPRVTETVDRFGNHSSYGALGVTHSTTNYERQSPPMALWDAARTTGDMSLMMLQSVGQIIAGTRSTDDLGGPVKIFTMSGEVAQDGFIPLLTFMAVLSVNLGLVNLFPIPVLDGGHLLFYAAEALMGRPLGRRTQDVGFKLGLAAVLTLMVFVTWNDVRAPVVAFLKSLVT